MTLAAIFLISLFSATPVIGGAPVDLSAQTSTNSSDAQSTSGTTQSPSAPTQAPAAPTKSPSAKPIHHKKKAKSGCPAAPVSGSSASNSSDPAATGSATGQTSSTGSANSNCPPPKVVVRQGGTSEPAIQLGGETTGGQAIQEKATATQMLETTDENLKKIVGRQLSATEQDMVTQIRQYMDQSKAAVKTEDPERARNLAWKAQTLSEDLLKTLQ